MGTSSKKKTRGKAKEPPANPMPFEEFFKKIKLQRNTKQYWIQISEISKIRKCIKNQLNKIINATPYHTLPLYTKNIVDSDKRVRNVLQVWDTDNKAWKAALEEKVLAYQLVRQLVLQFIPEENIKDKCGAGNRLYRIYEDGFKIWCGIAEATNNSEMISLIRNVFSLVPM